MDLNDLLTQLSAVHPAWAAVLGLIIVVLRVKGWLKMPSLSSTAVDPLKTKLQTKIGDRYDSLLASGKEDADAFISIYTQTKEPKSA